MLVQTISTLGLSQRARASVSTLQLQIAQTSDEVATGKRHDVAGYLGDRTTNTIRLRGLFEQTGEFMQIADAMASRMSTMQAALEQVAEQSQSIFDKAVVARNGPSPVIGNLQTEAAAALEQVTAFLNAGANGRFLFSGVAFDQQPMIQPNAGPMAAVEAEITAVPPATVADANTLVSNIDALFAPPSFETTFYMGAAATQPRVAGWPDGGTRIEYGVQGNDQKMRDVLQGLYMLAATDVSTISTVVDPVTGTSPYQVYVGAALDKLNAGIGSVRNAQAVLGSQEAAVAGIRQQHDMRQVLINREINQLEDVDPYETATRLEALQGQLEATYSVTARVSRLRLSDYL